MGRRKSGAKPWSVYEDRGTAYISTTIGGKRIRQSLGVAYAPPGSGRDARAVDAAAGERYRKLVEGRVLATPEGSRIATAHRLEELLALWLVAEKALHPKSWKTIEVHSQHFLAFAGTPANPGDRRTPLERLTCDDGAASYAVARLMHVVRSTMRSELSNLFGFFGWAKTHRYLASMPPRPQVPTGLRGKRTGTQRAKSVFVTHAQALSIIALLPEWAAKGGRPGQDKSTVRGAYRVRDTMRFAYETGLRPATLAGLVVPTHWAPGRLSLTITGDIDKEEYGREVPLSRVALEILERVAPEAGPVFGEHDYRHHYKAAAAKVLPAELARDFAPYDLRHARARGLLAASSDILGTGYLLGHTRATTTNRYLQQSQAAGAATVEAADRFGSTVAANEKRPPEGATVGGKNMSRIEAVRRRGLEPLRCYPLAPQATGTTGNAGEFENSERLETSENAGQRQGRDTDSAANRQHVSDFVSWARDYVAGQASFDAADEYAARLSDGEDL